MNLPSNLRLISIKLQVKSIPTINLNDHREAAWYITSVVFVCLSDSQTISFESLDVGSSFSLIRYISMEYGSGSYIKVIGSNVENRYSRDVKLR